MLLYKDYLFTDYSDFDEVTYEVKEENKKRAFTGGVRINAGMYRTAKEDEEYRTNSLKRELP